MQLIPIIKHGGLVDYWVRKVKETLRAGGEDIHYHSGTYLKTDVELLKQLNLVFCIFVLTESFK